MSRVLVAATSLSGHTLPLIAAAKALQESGHDVEFLGGSRFLDAARRAGLRASALRGAADYDETGLGERFPERAGLQGIAQPLFDLHHVFGDAIPDQHAQVQERLAADPDLVLVTDVLFLGAWPSATGAGLRPRMWVSLGITPLQVASRDTTAMGPAPVPPGGSAIAANVAANRAGDDLFAPAKAYLDQVVGGLGGTLPDSGYVDLVYALPDTTAQLTVPGFEFTRTDLPASVEFTGILPPVPGSEWEEPDWWHELDGKDVVVVTQGTLANADFSELIEPTIAALADEDVLTVAALSRDVSTFTAALPGNARVARWLPFDRLLPRARLLVSNGGYGGVQQAMAAGVPVVVTGVSEDKPWVGARVTASGAGVSLGLARPDEQQLRAAVQQVLGDDGFRQRAAELAEDYGAHDAAAVLHRLVSNPPRAADRPRG